MADTVVGTFLDTARKFADKSAMRFKRDDVWQDITWAGYEQTVRSAFGGLRSIGLNAGDKTAILSANRPEWHITDVASQSLGGVTVPIYATNSPPQVAYITGHSEAKAIVLENAAQLAKIAQVRHELPGLLKAIVVDPTDVKTGDFVTTWAQLLADGDAYNAANPKDFDAHVSAVMPASLANLV